MSPTTAEFTEDSKLLLNWYSKSKRTLPWRADRDAYRIWISEVMLQQTTVAAVVPYFERFIERFPNVKSLAESQIEDVVEMWAGLGYYSRARNMHKAAQRISELKNFPQTHLELIELPGFGPYTARAVASIAFDEKVGVLDGNVIRVLSRRFGLKSKWWETKPRLQLQAMADQLARSGPPSEINQALMELGALVCTPKNPACTLCPWVKVCRARNTNQILKLPQLRPRREREIWRWRPVLWQRGNRILLVENTYAPFLRGHWILPGSARLEPKAPRSFAFRGSVTHHDIYVSPTKRGAGTRRPENGRWVLLSELKKVVPASIVRKAVERTLR